MSDDFCAEGKIRIWNGSAGKKTVGPRLLLECRGLTYVRRHVQTMRSGGEAHSAASKRRSRAPNSRIAGSICFHSTISHPSLWHESHAMPPFALYCLPPGCSFPGSSPASSFTLPCVSRHLLDILALHIVTSQVPLSVSYSAWMLICFWWKQS